VPRRRSAPNVRDYTGRPLLTSEFIFRFASTSLMTGSLSWAHDRRFAVARRVCLFYVCRKQEDPLMYHAVGSPGSRLTRVTWMLEELGEPYEIRYAKPHSELIRSLNPSGKIPALVDGDFVVADSAAICIYLADKHADKGMGSGPGPAERAEMNSWLHFAQSELEATLWTKLKHRFLLPQELRVDVGPAAAYEFARDIAALEARLGDRPYALGDRFTVVDVFVGFLGNWARGGKFEIESNRVNDYFDRILARPALARARRRELAAGEPIVKRSA
jgi:glutathione S-transferase